MAWIQQALLAGKTVLTYATWNPSDVHVSITLSGGNLVADSTGNVNRWGRATIWKSSRKWYWEILVTQSAWDIEWIWVANSSWSYDTVVGQDVNSYWYAYNGNKYYNSISVWPLAYWATYWNGDIISVLLDMDAWEITFWKNWTTQGVAFTWISGTFLPAFTVNRQTTTSRVTAKFWATAFTYTPPAWYNNWVYS